MRAVCRSVAALTVIVVLLLAPLAGYVAAETAQDVCPAGASQAPAPEAAAPGMSPASGAQEVAVADVLEPGVDADRPGGPPAAAVEVVAVLALVGSASYLYRSLPG